LTRALTTVEKLQMEGHKEAADNADDFPPDDPRLKLDDYECLSDDQADDDKIAELNREYVSDVKNGFLEALKLPYFTYGLIQKMAEATDPTSLILEC
jgi:hypothetical protein